MSTQKGQTLGLMLRGTAVSLTLLKIIASVP